MGQKPHWSYWCSTTSEFPDPEAAVCKFKADIPLKALKPYPPLQLSYRFLSFFQTTWVISPTVKQVTETKQRHSLKCAAGSTNLLCSNLSGFITTLLPFLPSSAAASPGRCSQCRWRRRAVTPALCNHPVPSVLFFSSIHCPWDTHTEEGKRTWKREMHDVIIHSFPRTLWQQNCCAPKVLRPFSLCIPVFTSFICLEKRHKTRKSSISCTDIKHLSRPTCDRQQFAPL